MDLLINWVTQIVIFLIIALIIDLLIPATAMKKYIKLVVGLILILIFLKPVFYLFNMNIDQSLDTAFSKLSREEVKQDSMKNSIEKQKKEIQAGQRAYILEEMAVQLKDLAKDRLKDEYQAEIVNIDFQFKPDEEPAYENLEEVIVYLGQMEDEEEGAVQTVDNIDINTDAPVEDDEQDVQEIKHLLHDVWEINDEKLTIIWKEGHLDRKT
ncbi:stage III sporulation protein AF [Lentibacillus sp. L22]|uniref:stage III sporulation protein AF n=1 Tax=Lentibacillus TaxID=175304 RepID=UPI0022B1F765|nr:stage III sporulation protein AF [Lentibacillus daqui]